MFDKEYFFKGTHAEKVNKLTVEFDKKKNKLFNSNYDVYIMAAIVGFLYNCKADLDKGAARTKIFAEKLIKERSDLVFTYRLIMLLDDKNEPDFNKRVDKAFRYYGSEQAAPDEELYENYVRGGVDILYEKLIETAKSEEDYLKNLYDFVDEFEERYNQNVSTDNILHLCRLAKS